jgi:hypothetical protein
LDGSPIVDPYFRPQWLPNFSNIRAHCGIRSGLQKPGMKSCGVCALGCSAFRGSDRFTVTKSVQKGRGISLALRDLPVISALVAIRQTQDSGAGYQYQPIYSQVFLFPQRQDQLARKERSGILDTKWREEIRNP